MQIRGLGSNVGSVGTTAIYNDGVIAASRIASSGTFTEQDSVLFDTDRVEVLRGPQGTLYGEGSFGGVVNIISKRPNPQGIRSGVSGNWYDIKNGGSGGNDINGMINCRSSRTNWPCDWWDFATTTKAGSMDTTSCPRAWQYLGETPASQRWSARISTPRR